MYSVVLLSVLAATGSHHGCRSAGCRPAIASPAFVPGHQECAGYTPSAIGGIIAPYLFAGTPGPVLSTEDEQAWSNYLDDLDTEDRNAMKDTWAQSDFEGRRKLLGLLAKLRADQEKKKPADGPAPLTEQEQDAWKAHLKTLKGDALMKAEADWAKADLAGQRKLVEALKKSPPE